MKNHKLKYLYEVINYIQKYIKLESIFYLHIN